jgi:hypothetical protein
MRRAPKSLVKQGMRQNNFVSLQSLITLQATWVAREGKAARADPLLESDSGYERGLGALNFALDRLDNLDVDFD